MVSFRSLSRDYLSSVASLQSQITSSAGEGIRSRVRMFGHRVALGFKHREHREQKEAKKQVGSSLTRMFGHRILVG